jgi:RNA polymerase sigma-70 factor (ECF subfamily)
MTLIDPAVTSPTGCGDAAAIIDFVSAHRESMVRVARGYVRDRATAEDVVQETCIAALRGVDRFGGRASMRTWIFTILVNRAKTTGTRQSRVVPMSSLSELDRGADGGREQTVEDRVALAADAGAALAAIAMLPRHQRDVITLRDVRSWESHEVCALMGITEGNQRVLLHRARRGVRRALQRELAAEVAG